MSARTVDMYAGPGGYRGEYMAWDPVQRKKVWEIHEKFPVWSGTLVTAGNVAFYGTMDRLFKAIDAKSGQVLWQFRAGSGFIGQPVTYRGSDGQQYVAILFWRWRMAWRCCQCERRSARPQCGARLAGATQDCRPIRQAEANFLSLRCPNRLNTPKRRKKMWLRIKAAPAIAAVCSFGLQQFRIHGQRG